MIAFWAFNAMAFICNCALASSSTILAPIKDNGSLRFFKEPPNEFEYILKRHGMDDRTEEQSDSKERRGTVGSSFIRFGRSQYDGTVDNSALESSEADSKVSRHPRWKSPDIVIRFGRSGFKAANGEQIKRGRNDLNFIRFGRNMQVVPADLDLSAICSVLMPNGMASDADPAVSKLFRLCNSFNKFTGGISLDTYDDQAASVSRE